MGSGTLTRGLGVGSGSRRGAPAGLGAAPRADPRAGPAASRQKFPAVRRRSAGGRTPRPGLTRALRHPRPRGCRCPSPVGTPGLKGWGLSPLLCFREIEVFVARLALQAPTSKTRGRDSPTSPHQPRFLIYHFRTPAKDGSIVAQSFTETP